MLSAVIDEGWSLLIRAVVVGGLNAVYVKYLRGNSFVADYAAQQKSTPRLRGVLVCFHLLPTIIKPWA